jgi:hypothetical protein
LIKALTAEVCPSAFFFFTARNLSLYFVLLFKPILLRFMMRQTLFTLSLTVALAFTQGISAYAQSAPTSFKVDSTTQAALRADKRQTSCMRKSKRLKKAAKPVKKKPSWSKPTWSLQTT